MVSISLGGDEEIPYQDGVADGLAEEAISRGLTLVVDAGNSGCSDRRRPIPPGNVPSVITVGGYNGRNQMEHTSPDLYASSHGPTVSGFLKPEILGPEMRIAAPIPPGTAFYEEAAALSEIAAAADHEIHSFLKCLGQKAGIDASFLRESPEAIRSLVESLLRDKKIVAAHYQHVDGSSFAAPIVTSVVAQMLDANPVLTPAAIKHILISTADRIPGVPLMRQGYGVLNAHRALREATCEQYSISRQVRPPRIESGKLVLEYHNDEAKTVALAGDFNGWNAGQHYFTKIAPGIWRAEIDPPSAGRYRYKFVFDGQLWLEDPGNGLQEPDNFGGLNSVLNVRSSEHPRQ